MNIDDFRLLYAKGEILPERYIGFLKIEKRKNEVKAETWEAPADKNGEGTAYARGHFKQLANELQAEIEMVEEQAKTGQGEYPKVEPLPVNEQLEEIAKDPSILTRWKGGKYKCPKLPEFINAYAEKFTGNPQPYLIRDYLVKTDGDAFTDKTITERLNTYGIAREKKRAELKKKINKAT